MAVIGARDFGWNVSGGPTSDPSISTREQRSIQWRPSENSGSNRWGWRTSGLPSAAAILTLGGPSSVSVAWERAIPETFQARRASQ